MSGILRWYNGRLAARPLLTQAVTTSILFATGDITAQQLVEKRGLEKHDLTRTGRMALYGGCIFGPVATTWFNFLARRINPANPKYTTIARVACDQGAFAPVMIGVFLSSMATMEGSDPRKKLQSTWWTALKTNWMVWPFVQMINFTYVPLPHRVMFANIISIGWNSYLSWVNSQESTPT